MGYGSDMNSLGVTVNDVKGLVNKRPFGIVSIDEFGVKGDGITDDSIALQSLLDAGAGKVVYIPPSASGYAIKHSLEVPDNTTVIFPKEKGKLLIPADHDLTSYDDFLQVTHIMGLEAVITNANHTNGINVKIIGAYIDGQANLANDQPIAGIMLKNCTYSSVEDCYITGLPYISTVDKENRKRYQDILLFNASYCNVEKNTCNPVAYENIGIRYGSCFNKIINNICVQDQTQLNGHNIQVTSSWETPESYQCSGNIVENNVCRYSGFAGIICHNATRNIINKNIIYYPAAYGLSCPGASSYENTYTDNTIYNPNVAGAISDGIGTLGTGLIVYDSAERNKFIGNTVISPVADGIECLSNNNIVSNTIVVSPGRYGAQVKGIGNIIKGLHITSAVSNGVHCDTASKLQMSDVYLGQSGGYGLYLLNTLNSKFTNFDIESSISHGVFTMTSTNNDFRNIQSNYSSNNGAVISGDSNNFVNCTFNFNSKHGFIANALTNSNILCNYFTSNGTLTNITYDNLIIDNASNYNNVQSNTCRKGSLANKPKYGIEITNTANNNIVTNNDLYDSGVTENLLDNGVGTVTTAGNRVA